VLTVAKAGKAAFFLWGVGTMTACSDITQDIFPRREAADAQQQRPTYNELDPESLEKKVTELTKQSAEIASRVNIVSEQLSQLFSVKQRLCEIQTTLFGKCYAHTPLAGVLWKQSAVCRKKIALFNTRKFYVNLRGATGRFQLILDNTIESNVFNPEEESVIRWYNTGSRSLKNLKLSDISVFKLRAVDYEFPQSDTPIFTFKVDDKVLFDQTDFLENSRTTKSVLLNTLALRQLLSSNACRIDEAEIDEATENAIATAALPDPVQIPEILLSKASTDAMEAAQEWNKQKNREIQLKSESYLALARDIASLRHDLRGDLRLGCWANEPIRTVEFLFDGQHLPLSDWDRSTSNLQKKSSGDPARIEIGFGGGLVFVNRDENSGPIIRENGRLIADPQTDLTIGDISSVVIAKKGVSYSSFQNCWSTWGGLGKSCEWQNRESSRYRMNALTIKLNNETIYHREDINQTFDRNSLVWFERELTANQAYRDIMRRRDCPVH